MVAWEALDALSHEFELCKITARSNIVVLVDHGLSVERLDLLRIALSRSGAPAIEVRAVDPHADLAANELVADAIAGASVVITTGRAPIAGLADTDRHVLHLGDLEPHAFAPHASLRRRAHELRSCLSSGDVLTMTDPHGSELHFALGGATCTADHGFVGDDAPVASFPAGWAAIAPALGTVNGQFVIMPGDANVGATRLLSSPVRIHVGDDHVWEIQGDSPDADVIRALFEYAGDPNAYGAAELSIGLNPGPSPDGVFDDRLLSPVVSRLLAGTVTISFGDNPGAGRPCDQTITMALPGRSITVDGLPVITHGHLQGDFAPDVYEL